MNKSKLKSFHFLISSLGVFYIVLGFFLFLTPVPLLDILNYIPFKLSISKPIPSTFGYLWLITIGICSMILGISMIFLVIFSKLKGFVTINLLNHLVVLICMSYLFFTTQPYFAIILFCILEIITISLITYTWSKMILKEKNS